MHTNNNFSACFRENHIEQLQRSTFDVLVIGGGITGAGIAFDAANRDLNVALIEQNDFASGTSSRSTKLVHGGLRYLQQLQFKFVMQLGRERKILHHNNVNNVIPTPMILPIYRGGKLKKGLTRIALKIYDNLAGVESDYKTQWIKKDLLIKKYPFIKPNKLKGAFLYYEYKTNDGRMVVELLKKACEKQFTPINYTKLIRGISHNNKLVGVEVEDQTTGKRFSINATVIINASGAWCKEVIDRFNLPMPKNLLFTKGVHLVIDKTKLPLKDAFYFDTPDGRMIFAIPKQNHLYIGTTDTPFTSNLDHPETNKSDIEYLLNATNQLFKEAQIKESDITSCWSGIRSLIQNKNGKPSEISRHEELFESENGLISITGGKLTGYRLMAANTVDLAYKKLKPEFIPSNTENLRFAGSEWETTPSLDQLIQIADQKYDEAKQTGISANDFKPLFYRYGKNIDLLTEKAFELMTKERNPSKLWIMTEVWYATNFEMVCSLAGFFIYRTEMVLFEPDKVDTYKDYVLQELAKNLNWDDEKQQKEREVFELLQREYRINS